MPAAFQFGSYFHRVQGTIASSASLHGIVPKIIDHCARIAIDLEAITVSQRINGTEFKNSLSPILECTKDREEIRNYDIITLPAGVKSFPASINTADIP